MDSKRWLEKTRALIEGRTLDLVLEAEPAPTLQEPTHMDWFRVIANCWDMFECTDVAVYNRHGKIIFFGHRGDPPEKWTHRLSIQSAGRQCEQDTLL
jgi:hypothetical protein